ncbi:FMN-binding protein [Blastopirellula sp. JC732]|uniref:Ion-translocating oxidoreductase complex subunit G n=1 Tax=Blastopirellula sediminis TaxID=2894196 RepID=A0A9X1MKB7_9BACT|nr:FMN-binding protein [Blastopirellula sediminis]MCC9609413.1 FMN-binding protein [Blastopirellula sediminis]MCC9627810.1 FMN-binding protein [Blastopirellula sediminis]
MSQVETSHAEKVEAVIAVEHVSPAEESSASSILRIYGVVLAVGLICGLLIVSVFEITKPIIARNRIKLRESAILNVIDGATASVGYAYDESAKSFRPVEEGADLFAGFDDAGKLVGIAVETSAMGYQDNIRILYGYDPATETIVGMKVLESRETPGLGDRIEKDPNFIANFQSLDVAVGGDGLAHPLEFVKAGGKTQDWQIDGITGATISSRATATMLRESTNVWMPRIQACKSQFRQEEP